VVDPDPGTRSPDRAPSAVRHTLAPAELQPAGGHRAVNRTRLVVGGAAVVIATGLALLLTAMLSGGAPPAPGASVTSGAPVTSGASGGVAATTVPSAPSTECGGWGCAQQQRFTAAANLIKSKPGYLGAIVRDRQTGAVWRAGATDRAIWTSSTIKLAIATSLLERARTGEITLDAKARAQIAAMLHVSDNDAADALWERYGKDALVPRFQQVYGMTGLSFVSGFPRYWGFMKCTPEDLLRLMSYALDKLNPADRDYLVGAMRGVGEIQQWGVWAAGPAQQPGTKDGWSIESDAGTDHWCTSTVGFAGPDARYAVAAMYHVPPGGTIDDGVHAVSDLVATIFGAPTPARVTVPDPQTGL